MSNEDLVVRSLTVPSYSGPLYTSTITTANAYTTVGSFSMPLSIYGTGIYNPSGRSENGLIPETPEAWLRRRTREVCELAA